ncbi:MAG: GxxExxY protein [Prevotellaceae bacterium]|jgi:hypothetical protein|nr:GxxExxY protein [Prevotellaceae bacterium]
MGIFLIYANQGLKSPIIYYAGFEVGTRRADFIVENQVIIESKAIINFAAFYSRT